MRIADVLSNHRDDEYEGIDDNKRKRGDFNSSTFARSLISRWFMKDYSFTIMKRKKKSDLDMGSCLLDPPASSDEVEVDPSVSSKISVDSGRKIEDFSFKIGMGLCLGFLLAKSTTELNKMRELRAEMEMLPEEIKNEVRSKDVTASTSESINNISFLPSHYCTDLNTSQTISMPTSSECFALQEAKCDVESNKYSKHSIDFANMRCPSIDQMEAELEVELERLQCSLEGECSSGLQHRMEVDYENTDPSYETFSIDCEEEDNAAQDDNCEYNGVSARELERKLHELLELRQQEKIEELESALENAEQKLREKEMELEWWKETVACFTKQGETIHLVGTKT